MTEAWISTHVETAAGVSTPTPVLIPAGSSQSIVIVGAKLNTSNDGTYSITLDGAVVWAHLIVSAVGVLGGPVEIFPGGGFHGKANPLLTFPLAGVMIVYYRLV